MEWGLGWQTGRPTTGELTIGSADGAVAGLDVGVPGVQRGRLLAAVDFQ
jgi:hypothetical protein